jgi:hypothetical protein
MTWVQGLGPDEAVIDALTVGAIQGHAPQTLGGDYGETEPAAMYAKSTADLGR